MAAAKSTTDHDTIRRWVESRGGCPATVKSTANADGPGILRIDFPGYSGKASLEKISWNSFFEAFDENDLAFLYQDEKDSRFSKLVSRKSTGASRSSNGSAKASDGSSGREPHAVCLLETQHREVEALFEEHSQAENGRTKRAVFDRLADALAAHSKIEEELFYPAVFDDETEEELREAVEEHLQVKRMLADLLEMSAGDAQWDAKMEVLQEMVEHHVEEEEEKLFVMVEAFDEGDMRELGAAMEAMYDQLMRGSPRESVPAETSHAAPL